MPEPPEDDETLLECKACGGHWTIRAPDGSPTTCRWCTEGLMSGKQLAHWFAHKSGPRQIKVE